MTDQETGAPPPDPNDPATAPETAPADDPTATEPVEQAIEGGSVSVTQPDPEGATEEDAERTADDDEEEGE